jgi:hypothetical protein
MTKLIEYRVRPIDRFVITRFEDEGDGNRRSAFLGEYDSAELAHEVAYALCREEHRTLGWKLDDERIQYPKREEGAVKAE